ncbi:SRPBCC domain-containing protein [uncultured Winogradskyella sp.]|uniref:SRPBCC domain-containing protein n=1 Tax=uncultured Winogradskyella sp. TaxID=395353 RepID=UPI0026019968|nr:SRPBCC domain-containing protein [uncultured Winogradskyella sp.]
MLNQHINISDSDYKKQIKVSSNANQVFRALTEDIHLWWSNTSNTFQKEGGQFTIHFENGYWWTFKIIEFIPNTELIWKCIDGEPDFNKEWIGHILHWQIVEGTSETTINFHQAGLTPDIECYDICSTTWDMFITEKLKLHLQTSV